jgi:hypothetical protein
MKLHLPFLASLLLPFSHAISVPCTRSAEIDRRASNPSAHLPPGYPTTKGTQFWLDGYPFYFNGANVYWLSQLVYDSQYTSVFDQLKDLGVKVIRTWAFSQVIDEVPTTNLTYYQVSCVSRSQYVNSWLADHGA